LADFQDGLNAYDKQDYDAAFEEWQPLAKQGNADAQNNLGTMYANGKGVVLLHILAQLLFDTKTQLA
jgi:TPR repeat protein